MNCSSRLLSQDVIISKVAKDPMIADRQNKKDISELSIELSITIDNLNIDIFKYYFSIRRFGGTFLRGYFDFHSHFNAVDIPPLHLRRRHHRGYHRGNWSSLHHKFGIWFQSDYINIWWKKIVFVYPCFD